MHFSIIGFVSFLVFSNMGFCADPPVTDPHKYAMVPVDADCGGIRYDASKISEIVREGVIELQRLDEVRRDRMRYRPRLGPGEIPSQTPYYIRHIGTHKRDRYEHQLDKVVYTSDGRLGKLFSKHIRINGRFVTSNEQPGKECTLIPISMSA